MSRPTKIPAYRKHKQSGQAVVTLTGRGGRRDVLLGKYGSPDSHREYARVIAEWTGTVAGRAAAGPAGLSVNELLLAFWKFAAEYYRDAAGRPTSELHNYRVVVRLLRTLYGHTPAADFGPVALKAVRQQWATAGIVRAQVNVRVYRVRRIFRWAVGEEFLPAAVADALRAVDGLKRGRTEARESTPVRPVSEAAVTAVMPFLPTAVRAMVVVQQVTGMRPGEVCRMRWAEVSTAGPVWCYRPGAHKTAHRDKGRVVFLGPKAQAVLAAYRAYRPGGFVFSPRAEAAARREARSGARKTPRYPSHMRRNAAKRKAAPRRVPGACYAEAAYRRAIGRACEQAWPPPGPLARRTVESAAGPGGRPPPSGRPGSAETGSPPWPGGGRTTRGSRTSSATPRPPGSASGTGSRRRRRSSATRTSRRPRSTPNGTSIWRRGSPRRSADGRPRKTRRT